MPTTFPEYESFDGLGLSNLVQQSIMSPKEILEAAIERIEQRNPQLNAVICKLYDKAYSQIERGLPAGIFSGVPLLLKDLLTEYKGTPISFGSRFVHDNHWISPNTSELVKRFLEAGMMIIGKTNVPEFGLSPVTEPELFGPSRNPWDIEKTPGGSSGGAAAAVASGMLPIAHGSDGGGSLRIPAAFTGLFGFKPSRGRAPTGPVFMRVWLGMVVDHVLTRSVRDSAAMLDVLSGPELGSQIGLPKTDYSFLTQLDQPLGSLRIALIEKPFFKAEVHSEYREALKKCGKLCSDLGHHVESTNFEIDDELAFAFLIIMSAENAASVKQLATAIGRNPKAHELEAVTATLCYLGEEFTAVDYAWAVQMIDKASLKLEKFFTKYDVILTPTMPFPAPKIGAYKPNAQELIGFKLLRYMPYGATLRQLVQRASAKNFSFMAYTGLFNMGGQPAMSVPLYQDAEGMPIGIQFAAAWKQDALLLQLASQLEKALPWDKKLLATTNLLNLEINANIHHPR